MNNRKADDLDARLKKALASMLEEGYAWRPFPDPRLPLQRRFNLEKSRHTSQSTNRAKINDEG